MAPGMISSSRFQNSIPIVPSFKVERRRKVSLFGFCSSSTSGPCYIPPSLKGPYPTASALSLCLATTTVTATATTVNVTVSHFTF